MSVCVQLRQHVPAMQHAECAVGILEVLLRGQHARAAKMCVEEGGYKDKTLGRMSHFWQDLRQYSAACYNSAVEHKNTGRHDKVCISYRWRRCI